MTANQDLFDAALRHQVALRRYSDRHRRQMLALLEAADADLVAKLRARLGEAMEGGPTNRRLNALLKEIRAKRRVLIDSLAQDTKAEMEALAAAEAAWEQQIMADSIPVEMSTTAIPLERLKAAINSPMQGKRLANWFKHLGEGDRARLDQAVRLGVANGETLDDIVRRIAGTRANGYADGILATTRREAETIARTAVNHTSNAARNEVWAANQDIVWGLRWTSTLDGRTSPICQARDGAIAVNPGREIPPGTDLLDPQEARPPAHPNCRSLMVAMLAPDMIAGDRPFVRDGRTRAEREKDFRRQAREADPEAWKAMSPQERNAAVKARRDKWAEENIGTVPASTTYEEWMRRQPAEFQNATLGPSRAEMFRKGKVTLDQFVDVGGRSRTLSELDTLISAKAARQAERAAKAAERAAKKAAAKKAAVQEMTAIFDAFQNNLDEHIAFNAPPGWGYVVEDISDGSNLLFKPGGVVQINGPAVHRMPPEQQKGLMSLALGKTLMNQSLGGVDTGVATSVFMKLADPKVVKAVGPLATNPSALTEELYGLAIQSPGPHLTSWGTPSSWLYLEFSEEIKAIREIYATQLAKKPPETALAFPLTGHATPASYAKTLLEAGKPDADVLAATAYHFPDANLTIKSIHAYKAQLAAALKKANMPPPEVITGALKAMPDLDQAKVKKVFNALKNGKPNPFDGTPEGDVGAILQATFGKWSVIEKKIQPKITPVATPAEASEAVKDKLAAQFSSLGPVAKKAVAKAVHTYKQTGSTDDLIKALDDTFGDFDPVKGDPLVKMVKEFVDYDVNLPGPSAESFTSSYTQSLPSIDLTPSRPASTPASGRPPPPRFTEEQKAAAVMEEFGSLTHSQLPYMTDAEFTVITKYTGSWYRSVNHRLARGEYSSSDRLQAVVESAQEALRKMPPYKSESPLLRNISVSEGDMDAFLSRYRPGQVVEETRFTSTSTNGRFNSSANVQLQITKNKSGRYVDPISINKGEEEVLFPPGARFEIVAVRKEGRKTIVEMEEK